DWMLPGMLHGVVVRSAVPSAKILEIDLSEALEVPGVVAILTAKDVPNNSIVEMAAGGLGELEIEMPVLAEDRVRYQGEPIAVIAGTTLAAVETAAELVFVDYDDLPGVYDVEA